jgi:hypothetical protein
LENKKIEVFANMYRKVNGFDGANLEEDGDPR